MKHYIVVIEDDHGHDMVDDIFEDRSLAEKRFLEHKAERSYYCRWEEADFTGDEDDENPHDNNDTIESYYPEDDEEEDEE